MLYLETKFDNLNLKMPLNFEYGFLNTGQLDKDGNEIKVPHTTFAKVFRPDGKTIVAIGIANLHPTDQFNKKVGRKVAFADALRQLFPTDPTAVGYHARNREIRGLFWKEFLKKVKVN